MKEGMSYPWTCYHSKVERKMGRHKGASENSTESHGITELSVLSDSAFWHKQKRDRVDL